MAIANDLKLAAAEPMRRHESQTQRVFRRLLRSTNARVGLFLVVSFVLIAIFVPIFDDYDARRDLDLSSRLEPPSAEHWFGTDDLGRDVFRRVLHGARVSLQVAILSVSISLLFGSMIGLVAGMVGGWSDSVLMLFPGLAIMLTVLGFNLLGDGLRDALDPRLRM